VSAPLFLAPRASLLDGEHVVLEGTEGRHAVSVQRLRVGERIDLSDGEGTLVAGRVLAVHPPDRLAVEVLERIIVPLPEPRLVVVQAIPKGERGELAVELLTEVGADAVIPWSAARCIAQWRGERGERAWHKWEMTARTASKQSRRPHVPRITAPATTGDVCTLIAASAGAVVLHEESGRPLTGWEPPEAGEIVIVVGPEGGITDDERDAFVAAGAVPVHAGPSVMRTSTAGAAACAVLAARTGRWS
jgi:16S rRNA (uracil1498-N3)-methyltransferase